MESFDVNVKVLAVSGIQSRRSVSYSTDSWCAVVALYRHGKLHGVSAPSAPLTRLSSDTVRTQQDQISVQWEEDQKYMATWDQPHVREGFTFRSNLRRQPKRKGCTTVASEQGETWKKYDIAIGLCYDAKHNPNNYQVAPTIASTAIVITPDDQGAVFDVPILAMKQQQKYLIPLRKGEIGKKNNTYMKPSNYRKLSKGIDGVFDVQEDNYARLRLQVTVTPVVGNKIHEQPNTVAEQDIQLFTRQFVIDHGGDVSDSASDREVIVESDPTQWTVPSDGQVIQAVELPMPENESDYVIADKPLSLTENEAIQRIEAQEKGKPEREVPGPGRKRDLRPLQVPASTEKQLSQDTDDNSIQEKTTYIERPVSPEVLTGLCSPMAAPDENKHILHDVVSALSCRNTKHVETTMEDRKHQWNEKYQQWLRKQEKIWLQDNGTMDSYDVSLDESYDETFDGSFDDSYDDTFHFNKYATPLSDRKKSADRSPKGVEDMPTSSVQSIEKDVDDMRISHRAVSVGKKLLDVISCRSSAETHLTKDREEEDSRMSHVPSFLSPSIEETSVGEMTSNTFEIQEDIENFRRQMERSRRSEDQRKAAAASRRSVEAEEDLTHFASPPRVNRQINNPRRLV